MSVIIFDRQSKTFSTNFVSKADNFFFFFTLFVLAEAFQIKTNKQISPEVDNQHEKNPIGAVLRSTRKPLSGVMRALPDSAKIAVVRLWCLVSIF